ncbi:hypothetical protein [Gluconacetobacter tumulisoli]|uniref:YbjN domain-containing protein n=1 Tax=Gluconacetobacter tumulisoli TaxID=1286189 RepID=A0A7W4PNF4_9PROT|nr:hypothetical protein [Gluconacetobacter tumulisoli]MBB2202569.1 hypothetical protein [Gluconacetobacter tumulisoli]
MASVKETLQDLYKRAVEESLGAVAKIDEYGDIEFRILRYGNFEISILEDDPEYFRILYGIGNPEDCELSEYDFLKIANDANKTKKAIKVRCSEYKSTKNKYLIVSIESFIAAPNKIPDENLVKSIIERYMSALQFAIDKISESLFEEDKKIKENKGPKMLSGPR